MPFDYSRGNEMQDTSSDSIIPRLGRVLNGFSYDAQRIIAVQEQKSRAIRPEFDVREWHRLKSMVLGEDGWVDREQKKRTFVEFMNSVSEDVQRIVEYKDRIFWHLVYAFMVKAKLETKEAKLVKTKLEETGAKQKTNLYFQCLKNPGGIRLEALLSFRSNLRSTVAQLLQEKFLIQEGDFIKAVSLKQLPPPIPSLADLLGMIGGLNALIHPSLFQRYIKGNLAYVLKAEEEAVRRDDYPFFIELYEEEKSITSKLIPLSTVALSEHLKASTAMSNNAFRMRILNLLRNSRFANGLCFLANAIMLEMEQSGWNLDEVRNSKHPSIKRMYRQTGVSGLGDETPDDGIPISQEDKSELLRIKDRMLSNPLHYTTPIPTPIFSSGNILYWETAYRDIKKGRNRRGGKVYAQYYPAEGDRIVLFLHGKCMPGSSYRRAELLKNKGISSIELLLPGHEARKKKDLESLDPIFSASIYGTIEQIYQVVTDARHLLSFLANLPDPKNPAKKRYRSFCVWADSISTLMLPILLACEDRISVGVFLAPGDNPAAVLFKGNATENMREMYLNAGMTQEELVEIFRCVDETVFIRKIPKWKREKMAIYMGIGRYDLTIPPEFGEKAAEAARETLKNENVVVEYFNQSHFSMILLTFLHPERIVNFIDKNLKYDPEFHP